MKNFIELLKKYKFYILTGLLLIFFFRSCLKSSQIKKSNKIVRNKENVIDSLKAVVKEKENKLDSLPELIRVEKINIHLEYDEWISSKDRGRQLMKLHSVVKNNIKELQKK